MTGVGLCLPQLGEHTNPEAVRSFALDAERLGYNSLWVQDHFLWPLEPARGYGGRTGAPIPDQYQSVLAPTETLAAVAAWTNRVKLGTSILVQGNHWPVPLAQRLATIDLLSHGRLLVGLGQGWNVEEHETSGTAISERAQRMEEFVAVLRTCWGPDPVQYDGELLSVPPSIQRPKPVQRPHPPLLSGMSSEVGRDRTRRLFDGWNPAGLPVAKVAAMAEALDAERPPGMAPLTVHLRLFVQFLGPAEPVETIIEQLCADVRAARAAGLTEVIIEHNFWDAITSPDDWVAVPEQFRAVVEAAG